jgi:hypothetical protein
MRIVSSGATISACRLNINAASKTIPMSSGSAIPTELVEILRHVTGSRKVNFRFKRRHIGVPTSSYRSQYLYLNRWNGRAKNIGIAVETAFISGLQAEKDGTSGLIAAMLNFRLPVTVFLLIPLE